MRNSPLVPGEDSNWTLNILIIRQYLFDRAHENQHRCQQMVLHALFGDIARSFWCVKRREKF